MNTYEFFIYFICYVTYIFQFKSVLFCVGEILPSLLSDFDLKYLLVFDEGTVTTIHSFVSAIMHNSRTTLYF